MHCLHHMCMCSRVQSRQCNGACHTVSRLQGWLGIPGPLQQLEQRLHATAPLCATCNTQPLLIHAVLIALQGQRHSLNTATARQGG